MSQPNEKPTPAAHFDEAAWAYFVDVHSVGDVVEGTVVAVMPFGSFVTIGDGVDALAPKATWPTLPELDTRVRATIAAIDVEHHRVALDPA